MARRKTLREAMTSNVFVSTIRGLHGIRRLEFRTTGEFLKYLHAIEAVISGGDWTDSPISWGRRFAQYEHLLKDFGITRTFKGLRGDRWEIWECDEESCNDE